MAKEKVEKPQSLEKTLYAAADKLIGAVMPHDYMKMLEEGIVDCIIALPTNLFSTVKFLLVCGSCVKTAEIKAKRCL